MPAATLAAGARRDTQKAARAIARDNVSAARRFPGAVAAAARRIGDFPDIGVERLTLASPPYRFLDIAGFPYVAVYNSKPRPPLILRVL